VIGVRARSQPRLTVSCEPISPVAATAVRLLLLTGCRKSEILALCWNWVDFECRALRRSDSKMGAKVVVPVPISTLSAPQLRRNRLSAASLGPLLDQLGQFRRKQVAGLVGGSDPEKVEWVI
jgi:integrase